MDIKEHYRLEKAKPMREKALLVVTILFLSDGMGYVVWAGTTMSRIMNEFGLDITTVTLMMNIPLIFSVCGGLIVNKVVGLIGRKGVALLAGLGMFFCGTFPAWYGIGNSDVSVFYTFLAVRSVGGVFLGMFTPMSTSLISDYFEGTQKRLMYGLNTTFLALVCGVFLGLLVGYLTQFNWRYAYYIMTIYAIGCIFAGIGIPKETKEQRTFYKDTLKLLDIVRQPKRVWLYCLFMGLFMMLLHMGAQTNSLIAMEKGVDNVPMTASYMLSVDTFCGAISAATFAFYSIKLKRFTAPIVLMFMAIGFFVTANAQGVPGLIGGYALIGVAFGGCVNSMYTNVSSNSLPGQSVAALSLCLVFYQTFQFLTIFAVYPVSGLLFNGAASGNLTVAGIYAVALDAVFFVLAFKRGKSSDPNHLVDLVKPAEEQRV